MYKIWGMQFKENIFKFRVKWKGQNVRFQRKTGQISELNGDRYRAKIRIAYY